MMFFVAEIGHVRKCQLQGTLWKIVSYECNICCCVYASVCKTVLYELCNDWRLPAVLL